MSDMTPAEQATLRRAIEATTKAPGIPADMRELAFDLLGETESGTAEQNPFFAHNLAILVTHAARNYAIHDEVRTLQVGAVPLLLHALMNDPDDLAIPMALSTAPELIMTEDAVNGLATAACKSHAGSRLIASISDAFAVISENQKSALKSGVLATAARHVLGKLDEVIAREPDRENAVNARLSLLTLIAAHSGGQLQIDAFERLEALFEDADRHFGPAADRSALRLRAVHDRLMAPKLKTTKPLIANAVRSAVELGAQGLYPTAVTFFVRALGTRGWLKGQRARDLSNALAQLCEAHPNDEALRRAHTSVLEATGDDDALLDHHMDLVRSKRAVDDSAVILARHWIRCLEAGAPARLDAETEHWVAEHFPVVVAESMLVETALLLLERVTAISGPMRAGHLGSDSLLPTTSMAQSGAVVVRTVQLLADGGEPERALSVGHSHLKGTNSSELRLTLAKIHIGAAIRIAEAESLLRPLASESGAIATEARALRDQVVNHPSYEAERHAMMLAVEKRLGIGGDKAVRCRVLFPSDRYVLAEMPGVRAPAFYQHRYLRVMITAKSLPAGLSLQDVPKGSELTAKVVGEDDNKGDRIRVYWVGNEPIELLARPPEAASVSADAPKEASKSRERKKPEPSQTGDSPKPDSSPPAIDEQTIALEKEFGIGEVAPLTIRIEKVMLRRGLLLGRVFRNDDPADVFPHRIGIQRRFIPAELKKARFKGAIVEATVARAQTAKLRYDVTSEFVLVSAAPEPTTRDATDQEQTESEPLQESSDSTDVVVAITETQSTKPHETKTPASGNEGEAEASVASVANEDISSADVSAEAQS
ncbi:MAG: hypothetical protein VX223_05460 [Myxococcota bacterium]|nr:hypothetical protein [Myxococcota bacterium]